MWGLKTEKESRPARPVLQLLALAATASPTQTHDYGCGVGRGRGGGKEREGSSPPLLLLSLPPPLLLFLLSAIATLLSGPLATVEHKEHFSPFPPAPPPLSPSVVQHSLQLIGVAFLGCWRQLGNNCSTEARVVLCPQLMANADSLFLSNLSTQFSFAITCIHSQSQRYFSTFNGPKCLFRR